ncbi:MAG TPA: hypothetical protein VF765_37655 [Polyangiaceae bacterium]
MPNKLPVIVVLSACALAACSKDEPSAGSATSGSASAAPSTTPSDSAPAPSASAPPPAPTAAEPPHDCPPGSTGPGSFTAPCDAKGTARMMDSKWTKTGDSGPSFAVTNKGKLVILYGKIAVYFYDKDKKQLDVVDNSVVPARTRHFHTCSGSFFGGVMNPGEREVLTFSCVPKSVIPDGTVTIESEMPMVGFADASGKKVDFYWRNNDLAPDVRPKGGIK